MNDDKYSRKLRSKEVILASLPKIITNSDRKHTRKMYKTHGGLVKNRFVTADNPATYIGWCRNEQGQIVRCEGEQRKSANGDVSLAIKFVTIPDELAIQLDLKDPDIPDYYSDDSEDFLD